MTLSRFLRDYIYIPLGGNRGAEPQVMLNLMVTFLIGGLWHGAGWTFVFWGFLHGAGVVVHRLWKNTGIIMPKALAWFLTFNFVNITWVFFKANKWETAVNVVKGMAGMNGVVLPIPLAGMLGSLGAYGARFGDFMPNIKYRESILMILFFLAISLYSRNTNEYSDKFRPTPVCAALIVVLAISCLSSMGKITEFLYFNF